MVLYGAMRLRVVPILKPWSSTSARLAAPSPVRPGSWETAHSEARW